MKVKAEAVDVINSALVLHDCSRILLAVHVTLMENKCLPPNGHDEISKCDCEIATTYRRAKDCFRGGL